MVNQIGPVRNNLPWNPLKHHILGKPINLNQKKFGEKNVMIMFHGLQNRLKIVSEKLLCPTRVTRVVSFDNVCQIIKIDIDNLKLKMDSKK